MKVIIIAPHHDDEIIGCGGSICLHSQKGDQVTIVFVFSGWSAIPFISNKKKASQLIQKEAASAGNVLGVNKIRELNLPDRSFTTNQNILPRLIKTLRKEQSCEVLYIPHKNEGDREHRIVNELAREAIWLASSDYFPDLGKKIVYPNIILGYEAWSPLSRYQLAVDITSVIAIKEKALKEYKTQLQVKDWVSACIGLNSYRGVTTGSGKYVETFQILKVNNEFLNGGIS